MSTLSLKFQPLGMHSRPGGSRTSVQVLFSEWEDISSSAAVFQSCASLDAMASLKLFGSWKIKLKACMASEWNPSGDCVDTSVVAGLATSMSHSLRGISPRSDFLVVGGVFERGRFECAASLFASDLSSSAADWFASGCAQKGRFSYTRTSRVMWVLPVASTYTRLAFCVSLSPT